MPKSNNDEHPIVITLVTEADEHAVCQLLANAGLPHEGFSAQREHFLVARRAGSVVGVVGLEYENGVGWLRSLVVSPDERGRGIGARLYAEMLQCAKLSGVRHLYLVTTTAEGFFRRRGFRRENWADVPASIAATMSRNPMPGSSVCMILEMGPQTGSI